MAIASAELVPDSFFEDLDEETTDCALDYKPKGGVDSPISVPDCFFEGSDEELETTDCSCALDCEPYVDSAIMERADITGKDLDLSSVPRDRLVLSDSILQWIRQEPELPKENDVPKPSEDHHQEAPGATARFVKILGESRFGNQVTGTEDLVRMSKGFVPKNTEENTLWACRNFESWCAWRHTQLPDDPVPADLLDSNDSAALNTWLSLFVIETRRMDGKKFPSKTIDCLLAGLLRYTRGKNPAAVNFLDEKNPDFVGLRGTRDTVSRGLREEGIGASVKHAEVITREEKEQLWCSGVLGVQSPRALANAVYFTNGKNLCLRGGSEHHSLKLTQFTFGNDYVEYTENGSKISREVTRTSGRTRL